MYKDLHLVISTGIKGSSIWGLNTKSHGVTEIEQSNSHEIIIQVHVAKTTKTYKGCLPFADK